MNRLPISLPGGLGVVCAALGAALLYSWHAPIAAYPIPVQEADEYTPFAAGHASFDPPPRTEFAAIDLKPIFSPERRRFEAPREPETPLPPPLPPPDPPQVALIGIITEGTRRIAMIREPGEPYAVALNLGAEIDGWEVSEISDEAITLRTQSLLHRVALQQ